MTPVLEQILDRNRAVLHIQPEELGVPTTATVPWSKALYSPEHGWRRMQELTFQVFYVEVLEFSLDLAEQVHQIAAQRQRKLGVLQGSKRANVLILPQNNVCQRLDQRE